VFASEEWGHAYVRMVEEGELWGAKEEEYIDPAGETESAIDMALRWEGKTHPDDEIAVIRQCMETLYDRRLPLLLSLRFKERPSDSPAHRVADMTSTAVDPSTRRTKSR